MDSVDHRDKSEQVADVRDLIHGLTGGVLNTTALVDETALVGEISGSQARPSRKIIG